MVQSGADGLATTADVMGRPQDRTPHRGHRGRRLSDARTQLGTCPGSHRPQSDKAGGEGPRAVDRVRVFRYSDLIVNNGCNMSNKAQQLLNPDWLYTASEI